MVQNINPLRAFNDKKAKEFDLGVEKEGVDYLIKMNEEVNAFVKQNGLKTKDYKKFSEEQRNGKKSKG